MTLFCWQVILRQETQGFQKRYELNATGWQDAGHAALLKLKSEGGYDETTFEIISVARMHQVPVAAPLMSDEQLADVLRKAQEVERENALYERDARA